MREIIARHASWVQISHDGLTAASNRGTILRVKQELERDMVSVVSENFSSEGMTIGWSDAEVFLPVDSPHESVFQSARCDCSSHTLCRHTIRTIIWFQQRFRASIENYHESTLPSSPNVGIETPLDALEIMKGRGLQAVIDRRAAPNVTFYSHSQHVVLDLGADLRLAACGCGSDDLCAHKRVAKWLFDASDKPLEFFDFGENQIRSGTHRGHLSKLFGMGLRVVMQEGNQAILQVPLVARIGGHVSLLEHPIRPGASISEAAAEQIGRHGRAVEEIARSQVTGNVCLDGQYVHFPDRNMLAVYPQSFDWQTLPLSVRAERIQQITDTIDFMVDHVPDDYHHTFGFHVLEVASFDVLERLDGGESIIFFDRCGERALYEPDLEREPAVGAALLEAMSNDDRIVYVAGFFESSDGEEEILCSVCAIIFDGEARSMLVPALA